MPSRNQPAPFVRACRSRRVVKLEMFSASAHSVYNTNWRTRSVLIFPFSPAFPTCVGTTAIHASSPLLGTLSRAFSSCPVVCCLFLTSTTSCHSLRRVEQCSQSCLAKASSTAIALHRPFLHNSFLKHPESFALPLSQVVAKEVSIVEVYASSLLAQASANVEHIVVGLGHPRA